MATTTWRQRGDILLLTAGLGAHRLPAAAGSCAAAGASPARSSALGSLFGMVTDEQCDMPLLTRPAPHPPTRTRTNKASAKAKKRTRLWSLEFSMFKKRVW